MRRYRHPGEKGLIRHTEGKKDEFMLEVIPEGNAWRPTNEEQFIYLFMWWHSEEMEFSDGYGKDMPWFYSMLCRDLEGLEIAREAHGKEGKEGKEFFEECVRENADELIERLEELKEEVES